MREISGRLEFLHAGDDLSEKIEASVLTSELSILYLRWGLVSVEGLEIDGEPATIESLVSSGPEDLCSEIVSKIQSECGLSQEERKN